MTQQAPATIIAHRAGRSQPVRMVTLLASGALAGKVLGFARELLFARVFGASLIADSFRGSLTAVLIPLVPMQNEGVPAILVPMHRAWQEEHRAPEKLAALCVSFFLAAALIMIVVEALGGFWVSFVVGRMEPEGQKLVLDFIRLMALWMPACVLSNCLAAAQIATGRSRIAALRPVVLNLSIMSGVLLFAATGSLIFLPLLFAVSFNVFGLWCVWTLWREGALDPSGLTAGLVVEVSGEFLQRLRPLLAQPFAEQGQIWLERFVASGFAVGTLASIDYARTLTDSAVLLVSQPIGMAVLYKGLTSNAHQAVLSIAGPLLAISVPGSIYLALFSEDIVRVVFARGAFNETAVVLTSGALSGIAAGLWAITLGMILLRFLNSAGRNGRAALILASALGANAVLNLVAWHDIGNSGNGSMMIGLGEAARGLVLLAGTSIALQVHRPLLRLLLLCLPGAVAMALLSLVIKEASATPLVHLALGAAACLTIIFFEALLLMPTELMALRSRFAPMPSNERS